MTASNPGTDLVLPLRPHRFDPYGEDRQLQLTPATALPPVCPAHGRAATGPRDEYLRFWGKPGAYRQEGVGRRALEVVKSVTLGKIVDEWNEPTALIKATWPECEQCVARADARIKKLIVYYVGSLLPLLLGLSLILTRPSAFAWISAGVGSGVLALALALGPAVFALVDRYLVATLAPDASAVTVRVHPDFARAWSGQGQARW